MPECAEFTASGEARMGDTDAALFAWCEANRCWPGYESREVMSGRETWSCPTPAGGRVWGASAREVVETAKRIG